VAQTSPADKPVTAQFHSGADRKLGGWWGHSLLRAIRDQQVGAMADSDDAYCYIRDGKPYHVVPLTKVEGWVWPHEVPSGAVIVDQDGNVTVKTHIAEDEIPGPVYPSSLAQRVRESNAALGSIFDEWNDRAGYEESNVASGVADSSDTDAELVMYRGGKRGLYVTPLTPRGASKSVVAVAETDATSVTAGRYNPVVVHELVVPRTANDQITKDIRNHFAGLEWASGLKIFEIAPISNDEWVVSLGQTLDVMYRVHLYGNGNSLLYRANGQFVRGVNKQGVDIDEQGNLVAVASPAAPTNVPAGPNGVDLTQVSDDALIAELNRRLAAKNGR
jgi:hypothetical protein